MALGFALKMFSWIKEKFNKAWNWLKKKTKNVLLALGILGATALAMTIPNGAVVEKSNYELAEGCVSSGEVHKCWDKLNPVEKKKLKAFQIANKKSEIVGNHTLEGLDIQITDLKKIKSDDGKRHGVEVLARAWKNGERLSFGDGTVDIERFRMFNPSIFVPDTNGDIISESLDRDGNLVTFKQREDPVEAFKIRLAKAINGAGFVSDNIVSGKVGNTVTSCSPDADPETDSVDGTAFWSDGAGESFGTARSANGTGSNSTSTNSSIGMLGADTNTDEFDTLQRGFMGFGCTADIPDGDVINAVVINLTIEEVRNQFSTTPDIDVVATTKVSDTTIPTSDYETVENSVADTAFASRTFTDLTDENSFDWTLNEAGRNEIDKTGTTHYAFRISWDTDNSAPTWCSGCQAFRDSYMADNGSNEPLITVTHGEAVARRQRVIQNDIEPFKFEQLTYVRK